MLGQQSSLFLNTGFKMYFESGSVVTVMELMYVITESSIFEVCIRHTVVLLLR